MGASIAYLINQYPKVSHSFVRREILALERQGFRVLRIALRGWDAPLADEEDRRERGMTRYALRGGLLPLLAAGLGRFLMSPRRFLAALGLALGMARRADRPLPYHLAYLLEACRILPWLRAAGARHVHAHFGTNSAEVAMLAEALGGPPFSFTVHGPEEFDKPLALGLPEKLGRAAFAVAVSSFGRSQLYRWLAPARWDKVKVIHCGIEPAFHAIVPAPLPAHPRLVCVGRLCEQKGQLLLLEAARRLQQKAVPFELVLAGDGEMRAELEAFIHRHGLGRQVRITGWVSARVVREEILSARGLVLPSFAEGLPVAIMEAMALRRPVLATWVAGIPELVLPGQTGWLFPAGDVEALAGVLEDFLGQPAGELERLGEAAYRRVLERHCVDREAARLGALFLAAGGQAREAAAAPWKKALKADLGGGRG